MSKRQQPETLLKKGVRQYLQMKGYFVVYMVHHALSYPGLADLYAIKAGREMWIETKMPAGKQSEKQIIFMNDILSHGGEYHVVTSIEDIMRIVPP